MNCPASLAPDHSHVLFLEIWSPRTAASFTAVDEVPLTSPTPSQHPTSLYMLKESEHVLTS